MNNLVIFQETIVSTGVAQQFPAAVIDSNITIQAHSTNAAVLTLGNSSAVSSTTGYVLAIGAVLSGIALSNTAQLWVVGTAGDVFFVIGT